MSHFALAVISDGTKTLEDLMAPYQENNTDDVPRKYLEFVSEDIGPYEANYNEGIHSMYYDPDANPMQLLTAYDERFRVKGFRGSYGTNTHSVPDNWRRVDIPINLLYPTFDDYMRECEGYRDGKDPETNQYGYWENPNAKWDWYTVGGRWKKWADDTIGGCAVRVGEIRFNPELEREKAMRWYEHADKESLEFHLVSKGLSMEEYAELCSNLYFRACITPDGEWHEVGEMGWWGISSETKEEVKEWAASFAGRFLNNPDHVITVVDCHI